MTATPEDRAETRRLAEAHLRALVGPREGQRDAILREDQWVAIEALAVDRRRALVVQRTGWGKSAVYCVATALLRSAWAGPTVIVSPLLARKLETDVIPILQTLTSVAPDLHDLLDVSRELNEMLAKLPGMGRLKKRVDEEQGLDT